MLDKFRGLPTDRPILDVIPSSFFNGASHSHNYDTKTNFLLPALNPSGSNDEAQSNYFMKSFNQDLTKMPFNPSMFLHPVMANSFSQKSLMLDLNLDKETSEEVRILSEDLAYSDSSSVDEKGNKRGKYKTYTEDEKTHIVNFMVKHGMEKTLEMFSGDTHKLTKRKLKGWLDGLDKVKGVKGRKSNDPGRDEALSKWCAEFQTENGRPPSRKEATKKALELNGDPSFMASKGWLDKFSKKFNIEFTSLKILPPRGTKKIKTTTDSKTSPSSDSRNVSPLLPLSSTLKEMKPKQEGELKNELTMRDNSKISSLFNLTNLMYAHQQQQPNQQAYQNSQIAPNDNTQNLYQNILSQDFGFPLSDTLAFDYQALSYLKNYPMNFGTPYSMPYQANFTINYQAEMQENLQQLQKMMIRQQKESIKFDKR